jgi:hypothetical protein
MPLGRLCSSCSASIGLTQAGLAERLRVSRRAIGEWEGGINYPKAEHVQFNDQPGARSDNYKHAAGEILLEAMIVAMELRRARETSASHVRRKLRDPSVAAQ